MLLACLTVPFAAGSAGQKDDFSSDTLQPFWKFINPENTASYNLTIHSGYLRLTAANQSTLTLTPNQNAPRIIQSVTDDFIAATYVTGNFSTNNHAGLLLWKDSGNFIRLEKWGTTQVLMYTVTDGQPNYQTATLPASNNLFLKLEKVGDTLTGYYSSDDVTWKNFESFTLTVSDPVDIGLLAINSNSAESSFNVDFDYFRVSPSADMYVPVPTYPLGILGASVAIVAAFLIFRFKSKAKKSGMA